MKCSECNGEYKPTTGTLQINDKYMGLFIAEHLEYMKCSKCGDLLYSIEAAQAIEAAREGALQEILQSKSISQFLSVGETSDFLGISRQALHKHRRIRRGFIFQTVFGGKTVYLKKSVELFKTIGDGRFALRQSPENELQYEKEETRLIGPDMYIEIQLLQPFPSAVYQKAFSL